jgi:hypothetical protein
MTVVREPGLAVVEAGRFESVAGPALRFPRVPVPVGE